MHQTHETQLAIRQLFVDLAVDKYWLSYSTAIDETSVVVRKCLALYRRS